MQRECCRGPTNVKWVCTYNNAQGVVYGNFLWHFYPVSCYWLCALLVLIRQRDNRGKVNGQSGPMAALGCSMRQIGAIRRLGLGWVWCGAFDDILDSAMLFIFKFKKRGDLVTAEKWLLVPFHFFISWLVTTKQANLFLWLFSFKFSIYNLIWNFHVTLILLNQVLL